jgi:hypothetical protein
MVSGDLRDEILFWSFVDQYQGGAVWLTKRHIKVTLATDSSGFAWGASLGDAGGQIYDLWSSPDDRPIHLKEAEALFNTLQAVQDTIINSRVDVQVDNQALVAAWQNQRSKDLALVKILKSIVTLVAKTSCDLKLMYVSSADNPADAPSRTLALSDSRLSESTWKRVEELFGPHSCDMMALDSNAMRAADGSALPHFTPWPLPDSAGVNLFAQRLSSIENYYCFPPYCLVSSVLAFILGEMDRPLRVSLVVPRLSPLPVWWPNLVHFGSRHVTLGDRGDEHIIEAPSKRGFVAYSLTSPLLLARFELV